MGSNPGTATGKQRAAIPHPGRPRYYRALFDQLADPVFLLDTETLRFVDANEAASRCYGYTHDEFLRMTVLDLHPQDEQERVRARVKAQMTGRSVELRHVTKDGRQLTVEITSAEVEHEGHACRLSIVHDISGRVVAQATSAPVASKEAKQAQDDLALQKAYLEQLFEAAPEAIVVLDTARRVSRVNREFTHMFGYSAQETVGKEIDELIVPEGKRSEAEHVTESVRHGSMVSLETVRRRKDGSTVEVSILGTPVSVGGGQVAFYAIYRDITDQKRAEKALTESESIFRAMADTSASAIYIHNGKRLLYVNAATEALTGYGAHELLGRDPWEIVSPEYRHLRETARVRHPGEPVPPSYDCKIATKSGEQRWLEFSSSWIRFKGEKAILVTAFDVTDRKRSEALQSALYRIAEKASSAEDLDGLYAAIHHILGELMYAKNCYIAVYDAANDMVTFPYFVDEKDKFTPPRKFARGLTEYVLRTGQPLLATPEALDDLVQRGEVHRIGAPSLDWMGVPLKQGDKTFGALVLQSYEDKIRYGEKEKEILLFVSQQIATAIEHKRNQDAIRESEAKFRALAESATPAIYIYDENRFLYVNPATERLLGYSAQELLAMEDIFDRLLHPDFQHAGKERAAARLRGGPAPARDEFQVITKSGEERWVDFSATTIQFGGKPANVATAVDITERKRGEALQSALYRIADKTSSAEDLPEFYASIHKIVGELMYARNFYIALHDEGSQTISFVYFQDEVDTFETAPVPFGKGLTEYVLRTGQSLLASPAVYQQLISSGAVQVVGVPAVDWLGVPLKKGDKAFGVLAVQSYHENIRYNERDKELLTFVSQHVASAIEHKRNEEALRQSEARYRSLVQSAVYGIYRSTVDDRFVDVNPALVAMLGYSSPDELRRLRISRDVYAEWEEHERLLNECRTKGRLEDMEVKWKRKDASLITVRLSGRAVTNAQGQMQGLEMIAEDITERRALEDQLRQAQKMEAVGRLAGGVAHDFNNLLTVIKGYSELMLKELKPSDPLHSEVEEVQKAADRAASLTRQLLAFSRQQVMAPKVLDLNQVVGNMDKLLRRLLGEDVDLFTMLDPHIGRVKADPGQLEQVIMNLAVNARDAMPKGGKLTIETANVSLDANYAREHVSVKPGSYVMMAVTDNGIGMDAETCARVFEPFFTTKEQGKGTGLGLSTVYGIVKQSGGYIWVYSEVGRGTSFKVYLPRVDEAPESVGPRETSAAQRGTETVLLVEDEDGVRALIRQVLHKHGYTVIQARHGGEALLLCERHPGQIHLLLTDVVLAQMSGDELADRLAAIRPEMKVLFMSGYTDEAIVQHGVLRPGTAFLQKPFTTDSLLRIVREVLDVPKSN